MVPESSSQTQAWHGGTKKRCWNGKSLVHPQNIFGKCSRSRHFEEESHSWFRCSTRTARQSRLKCCKASWAMTTCTKMITKKKKNWNIWICAKPLMIWISTEFNCKLNFVKIIKLNNNKAKHMVHIDIVLQIIATLHM